MGIFNLTGMPDDGTNNADSGGSSAGLDTGKGVEAGEVAASKESGNSEESNNQGVKLDDKTDAISSKEQDGKNNDGDKSIIIDGPLSHIYTQALNAVYAKEEVGTMFTTYEGNKFLEEIKRDELNASGSVDENGTYVYTVDNMLLGQNGLVEATEHLLEASKKYKNLIVAMESHGIVSTKMQLLYDFSSSLGAKVYHKRSIAVEAVKKASKKDT